MYRILLDDRFYRNTIDQGIYLNGLLQIFKTYFDAKIVFFEPFGVPVQSYNIAYNNQQINNKILKTQKVEKFDLSNVKFERDEFLEKLDFDKLFIGKIKYIINLYPNDNLIIPYIYDKKYRKLASKSYDNLIYFIGNYDEEIESNISYWITNGELINIKFPNEVLKFPAKDLCNRYSLWRSEILKSYSAGEKEALFTNIGLEVAIRNNYLYDSILTAINKKKAKKDKNKKSPKRQVFKSANKEIYLSTDFENGGFEVYDKNARHQGQYKFNGDFEKAPNQDSHPLYLK